MKYSSGLQEIQKKRKKKKYTRKKGGENLEVMYRKNDVKGGSPVLLDATSIMRDFSEDCMPEGKVVPHRESHLLCDMFLD